VHHGHEREVCELFFGAGAVRRVVQNEDVCARLREHPLEDVDSKASEAAAVGHHDLRDSAALSGDQKPMGAFAALASSRWP
jgi:hypothetical protein